MPIDLPLPHLKELIMKPNIGNIDRTLRIAAGFALLSVIFIFEGNAKWFGLIGIVLLFTAAVRWCPAYAVLGLSKTEKLSSFE